MWFTPLFLIDIISGYYLYLICFNLNTYSAIGTIDKIKRTPSVPLISSIAS